jgi:eukaryotic-like serine/threonine-protein kinase
MNSSILHRCLSFLAVLLVSLVLVQCKGSKHDLIIVPDLRGKPIAEAQKDLDQLELKADIHIGGFYTSVPEDFVVSQIPYPFTRVKKGRTVKLELSQGKSSIKLPNFVGMKFGEAHALIEKLGLRIESITEVSSDKPPGTITLQEPNENQVLEIGSGLHLTLSLPDIPLVPDWTDQPFEEVKYAIIEHGYILGTVEFIENPFHPRGSVYVQEPIPFSPAEAGTRINLVVNEKP